MMAIFTVVLEEQIEASSVNEAMRKFQSTLIHPLAPSLEVKVCEGSDMSMLSAREIEYRQLPKRQFMWRSNDYATFQDAQKDGAIYPTNVYAPDLSQINAVLKIVDDCIGSSLGLKVTEW